MDSLLPSAGKQTGHVTITLATAREDTRTSTTGPCLIWIMKTASYESGKLYSSAFYWQTYYSDIFTFISLLCEIRTTWKQITINQTTQRAPPLIAV